MQLRKNSLMYWVPRVGAIAYALFLSLFTFDAWEGTNSFWEGFLGWLIHLLPVAIVALALIIAWRRPFVGGLVFFLLGALFLYLFASDFNDDWTNFALTALLIAGPLILLGILFLWESRHEPRRASPQH